VSLPSRLSSVFSSAKESEPYGWSEKQLHNYDAIFFGLEEELSMQGEGSCGCPECKKKQQKGKSRMMLMIGSDSPENESKKSNKTTSKEGESRSLFKLLQIRFPAKVQSKKKKKG
jgi:hypothetical protein